MQSSEVHTPEVALAYFDSLETVELDFMIGKWKGASYLTGHLMDGLLELLNWDGKEFISPEEVHPLRFKSLTGNLYFVDPIRTAMGLAIKLPRPVIRVVKYVFLGLPFLFSTKQSRARLRLMDYRGKASAAMVYDHLPIIDNFRRIDENTVLGAMDYKAISGQPPFFFLLHREV